MVIESRPGWTESPDQKKFLNECFKKIRYQIAWLAWSPDFYIAWSPKKLKNNK